jgi:NADPH-dependent 2,4-dienoyl-CoA reductase/sulfur reductase-like enzyme
MGKERLVVIGGVAAGMSAASSYKRLKPEAEAIVLERDYFISYGSCSLPYYVSDDVKDFNQLIPLPPKWHPIGGLMSAHAMRFQI